MLTAILIGVLVSGVLMMLGAGVFMLTQTPRSTAARMRPYLYSYHAPLPISAESVLLSLDDDDVEAMVAQRPYAVAIFEVDADGRVMILRATGPDVVDYMHPETWRTALEPAVGCVLRRSRVQWSTRHPTTAAEWSCIAEPLDHGDEVVARVVATETPTYEVAAA